MNNVPVLLKAVYDTRIYFFLSGMMKGTIILQLHKSLSMKLGISTSMLPLYLMVQMYKLTEDFFCDVGGHNVARTSIIEVASQSQRINLTLCSTPYYTHNSLTNTHLVQLVIIF